LIGTADFKLTLLKFNLGMGINEVNRFTRYVEKDSNMMIDYLRFILILNNIKTEEELNFLTTNPEFLKLENMNMTKERLIAYLKDNNIHSSILVRKLFEKRYGLESKQPKKLTLEDFGEFLFKICKNSIVTRKACVEFAQKVDIDHDNQIDENDLQIFLNRLGYIEEADKMSLTTNSFRTIPTNTQIFPKIPLSEEKIEVVLRDLRQALDSKKISFHEFIKMIDVNEIGFITINDLSAGLDKVIKFSQHAKDGLFAYVDKLKMGVINYADFMKILKRSVTERKVVSISEIL
jgi:Ca2+-binding EF-hand superfamily protein